MKKAILQDDDSVDSDEFCTHVQCQCGEEAEFEYRTHDNYGNQEYKATCPGCGQEFGQFPNGYHIHVN